MAITAIPYGLACKSFGQGKFDFTSHTFKLMLASASYNPGVNWHEYRADVSSEIVGVGYVSGGTIITGLSWVDQGGFTRLSANPATWTNATITARYGIVYRSTGSSAADPLLLLINFGQNVTASATTFQVIFASGVLEISTT